jgi:hypothetical protein
VVLKIKEAGREGADMKVESRNSSLLSRLWKQLDGHDDKGYRGPGKGIDLRERESLSTILKAVLVYRKSPHSARARYNLNAQISVVYGR